MQDDANQATSKSLTTNTNTKRVDNAQQEESKAHIDDRMTQFPRHRYRPDGNKINHTHWYTFVYVILNTTAQGRIT
jgi:hypothetical protein